MAAPLCCVNNHDKRLCLTTTRVAMVVMMILIEVTRVKCNSYSAPSMSLTVTAPTSSDSRFSTWISPLASSLLPPSTAHGVFWGAVSAQDVQTICQLVEYGWQTMDATIDAYGSTTTQTIQLVAIGGCDASSYSPIGVDVLYIDDSGRSSVLICDNNAWSIGCAIYVTGDDVENIVNNVQNYGQVANVDDTFMANFTNKKRKILQEIADGECGAVALGLGGSLGVIVAANVCPTFGPFAILCLPASAVIGALASSVIGSSVCDVMARSQCFPGEGTVVVPNGQRKSMFELSIGDKVAVRDYDGSVKFESIYAFGHADGNSFGSFIKLELESLSTNSMPSRKIIHISPLHFCVMIEGSK